MLNYLVIIKGRYSQISNLTNGSYIIDLHLANHFTPHLKDCSEAVYWSEFTDLHSKKAVTSTEGISKEMLLICSLWSLKKSIISVFVRLLVPGFKRDVY